MDIKVGDIVTVLNDDGELNLDNNIKHKYFIGKSGQVTAINYNETYGIHARVRFVDESWWFHDYNLEASTSISIKPILNKIFGKEYKELEI